MQNEVKKITRLVDEVTSLLMRSGSNDINVRIKRDSELSTITIIDYNSAYPDDEISSLNDVLNKIDKDLHIVMYRCLTKCKKKIILVQV